MSIELSEREAFLPTSPLPDPVTHKRHFLLTRRTKTILAVGGIGVFLFLLSLALRSPHADAVIPFIGTHYDPTPLHELKELPEEFFNFTSPKPSWLSQDNRPPTLRIRMGIISAPGEFERRKAFRQYIIPNLPPLVSLSYRFLVGAAPPSAPASTSVLLLEESVLHQDIVHLDMIDSPLRLGEKRWRMLKWAGEAHPSTYDYFLNADSDAFLRLGALAQRMRFLRPDLADPHSQPIIWANMASHKLHLVPNPYDTNDTVWEEDQILSSDTWYPYPYGYAYLLSANLTARLNAPSMNLAHHIHFPSDDVLVGMWVAENVPDALVVDDSDGFHNPPGRSTGSEKTIEWASVVVHHLEPAEMRAMRVLPEFEAEWTQAVSMV